MAASFVGSIVSLDCGASLGTYQGLVLAVDSQSQTITLTKPFRNGMQCKVPNVTICANDILDLKLIKSKQEASTLPEVKQNIHASPTPCSEHPEAKPAPTAPTKVSPPTLNQSRVSPRNGYHRNHNQSNGHRGSPSKNMRHANGHASDELNGGTHQRRRANSASEQYLQVQNGCGPHKFSTPQKAGSNSRQQQNGTNACSRRQYQQGDTFNAPVDSFSGEFDFEKNLALFDKRAVFEKIENSGMVEQIKPGEKKQPAKYGCHENVIVSGPVQYRQIEVEGNKEKEELVTDSGLVVPCVQYERRQKLLDAAASAGLTPGRQLEMVGRSATEMVLQLCGGSHRLNPRNAHQRPVVVVLVGPHMQGAQAANCARQLASHNVHVTVFKPNYLKVLPELEEELQLLSYSQTKVTSSTKELPTGPVDVIISAIESHTQSNLSSLAWYTTITQWANTSKAPVLKLDPPASTASSNAITAKWLMGIALPLAMPPNSSKVYLCDLGIPKKVYRQVGIKYVSPFEHKFVIPLHPTTPAADTTK